VRALTGCSIVQSYQLVQAYSVPDPDDLGSALAMLEAPSKPQQAPQGPLALPPEFQTIVSTGARGRYWRYLQRRGFDPVGQLTWRYNLMCATTGKWKDRVIFPLYQNGELIGWTGRAMQERPEAPRYLSSSDAVKKTVLFEDDLHRGGRYLYIVEGPFDALKLDYYGEGIVRATCGFGTSLSIDQIAIISDLRKKFGTLVIAFDRDAHGQAMELAQNWDAVVNFNFWGEVKDPGAMTKDHVKELVDRLR